MKKKNLIKTKPMFNSGNILVTSSAKKVPMVQALQKAASRIEQGIKVIAGDLNENALTRYVADDFWNMPRTEENEAKKILAGCLARNIRVIFPTRDGELNFWAGNKALFAKSGIHIIVSPSDSVYRCLDKLVFAKTGINEALPFIPTSSNPQDLSEGPYVVKERFGAGSRMIGLNLNLNDALKHGQKLAVPIFQPYIEGKEVSVDAWLDNEYKVKGLIMRTRDWVKNGESQITTTFRDEHVEVIARKVLEKLKLCGPVVMQIIIDKKQKVHVIECNARFGGASTASIAAGLDSLYWSLVESFDGDTGKISFNRKKGEVRQIRVPKDIYIYDTHF